MSKVSKIREIYMGQLDAKDEINYGTEEAFLQCFVMPPNYDVDELIDGHKFLINGFKGVGKTALLFYLESICIKKDPQTCTSYILFKTDYKDIEKGKLDSAAKRLIQSISFDNGIMEQVVDFSDIWKVIIFQKIIEDNGSIGDNLFVDDENWNLFVRNVKAIKILEPFQKQMTVPKKMKIFGNVKPDGSIMPGFEIDFQKEIDFKMLSMFNEKVKEITQLFTRLKRTDIPYYIFIDELEAFYAEEMTFKRDLTMLRDLILTIKEINYLIISSNMKNTKLICSVRTEIINSIHRFIPTKELNKVISGFECKLNWNYTNTTAIEHPLFKILLKRLELTDSKEGVKYNKLEDVFFAWFQKNDQTDKVINHILNILWNKPRDIIRLISAWKNSTVSNLNLLTQDTINRGAQEYSNKSLEEISGELNAIYLPIEIDTFLSWLRGFKSPFSLKEFYKRIESFEKNNNIREKINIEMILEDLYRVGIIGNYNPYLKSHRWQHKNDEKIIIDDSWLFVIHNGLNSALSVTRAKKEKNAEEMKVYSYDSTKLKVNENYNAIVTNIIPSRVFVEVIYNNEYHKGSIHISKIANQFINDINDFFKIGDEIVVKVKEYDPMHRSWILHNSLYLEELFESCEVEEKA